MRPLILLCFLALALSDAQAQEAGGAYFGLMRGSLAYENVDVELGFRSFAETSDQLRLVGAYQFNGHTAIEVAWANAPGIDYGFKEFSGGGWVETLVYRVDAEIETLTVRAVGTRSFKHFSLVGGAGYYLADVDGSYNVAWGGLFLLGTYPLEHSPNRFDHLSHRGVTLSGGIQFDFDVGLSLRTEAEYFFTPSDVSLYTVNLGLLYRLGRNGRGRDRL